MKRIFRRVMSIMMTLVMLFTLQLNISAATNVETKLNDMGLLLNITAAELDATLTRDVGLTMILKSLGYTQGDANAAASSTPFVDVNDWAKGWAALAYQLNITTGVSATNFDPKGTLTEKQFVAFQLRALEYNKTAAWNNAASLGVTAGLIEQGNTLSDNDYTKRQAATVMYNALLSELQETKITLIEKLVANQIVQADKAAKYGLIDTAFKVKDIESDNLKLIQVTFTKAIDEEFLTNDTLKVYKNDKEVLFDSNILNGVTAYQYAFDVVEDNVVNIVFGTANLQYDIITLEIDGLLTEDKEVIDSYKIDLKLKDNTTPYVVSVEAANPKMIKVTYNEPVQFKIGSRVFDDVFLDGLRLAGTASLSNDKQVLTFELTELMDEGTHEFEIEGTTDYAGLVGDDDKATFNVVADNSTPYVEIAKAPNRNQVIVEFSEVINTTKGYIKIAGKTYNLTDTSKVTIDDYKVYIDLDTSLTASDAFTPISGAYKDIEDLIGNKVKTETAFSFKADFDDDLPTLTAEVGTSNEIIVTFSEPVQSFTSINFVVQDEDEKLVNVVSISASGSSKTVYKIILSNPIIDRTTYTLSVKGVKDLSVIQNTVADTEVRLIMYDKKQPEVTSVRMVGDETVRITFSEEMKLSKIGDPVYYMYNDISEGTNVPVSSLSNYKVTTDVNNKYVDLYIPGVTTSDKVAVSNVTDVSGTVLKNYNAKLAIIAPNAFRMIDIKAKLIDLKTIELVATGHEFYLVNANDFIVRTSTGDSLYHYVASATIDSSDASKAILKLNANLDSDAKYKGKTQYLYLQDETITMDTYNQKLDIQYTSPLSIDDYVKPTVEVNLDTSDSIVLEFSEVVSAGSNAEVINDILLKDKDGSYVTLTVGGNVTFSGGNSTHNFFDTITIDSLNGGESYTLEVVSRYIQDAENNSVEKFDKTTFTVKE